MGMFKLTKKEDKDFNKALTTLYQTELFEGCAPTDEEKEEARRLLLGFASCVRKRRYPAENLKVGDSVFCNAFVFGSRCKKIIVRVESVNRENLTAEGVVVAEGKDIDGCKAVVPFGDIILK